MPIKPLSRTALKRLGLSGPEQLGVQQWEILKTLNPVTRRAFRLLQEVARRIDALPPGPKHDRLCEVYREAGGCLYDQRPERAILLLTGQIEPSTPGGPVGPKRKTGRLVRFKA